MDWAENCSISSKQPLNEQYIVQNVRYQSKCPFFNRICIQTTTTRLPIYICLEFQTYLVQHHQSVFRIRFEAVFFCVSHIFHKENNEDSKKNSHVEFGCANDCPWWNNRCLYRICIYMRHGNRQGKDITSDLYSMLKWPFSFSRIDNTFRFTSKTSVFFLLKINVEGSSWNIGYFRLSYVKPRCYLNWNTSSFELYYSIWFDSIRFVLFCEMYDRTILSISIIFIYLLVPPSIDIIQIR